MADWGLESLTIWQKSITFAESIYNRVLPLLPAEEKWCMGSQLRRSAQSIPANIAEGYGRYYYQENIHFCYIARGSLEETLSHLFLARRLQYIPEELFLQLSKEIQEIRRSMNGYIQYLKTSKRGKNEPGSTIAEEVAYYQIEPDSDREET